MSNEVNNQQNNLNSKPPITLTKDNVKNFLLVQVAWLEETNLELYKKDKAKQQDEKKQKEYDIEQKFKDIQKLIKEARNALSNANYGEAARLLADAVGLIAAHPELRDPKLAQEIKNISSEMNEIQNSYMVNQTVYIMSSEDKEKEIKKLSNENMGDYYLDAKHRKNINFSRKKIEKGEKLEAPILAEYVDHILSRDSKEIQKYMSRLVMAIDHLENKPAKTQDENQERKVLQEELKGLKMDHAVHHALRELAEKETGKASLASVRKFVHQELKTEKGQERIQTLMNKVMKKADLVVSNKKQDKQDALKDTKTPSLNILKTITAPLSEPPYTKKGR
ncbi:MAG: hypothetical protein AB8U25_02975 [Rickettsiales endosymbiont of Dermacentor nuttalli]